MFILFFYSFFVAFCAVRHFCLICQKRLSLLTGLAKSEEFDVTFINREALASLCPLCYRIVINLNGYIGNVTALPAGYVVMLTECKIESVAGVSELKSPDIAFLCRLRKNTENGCTAYSGVLLVNSLVNHTGGRVICHTVKDLCDYAFLQSVSFDHC